MNRNYFIRIFFLTLGLVVLMNRPLPSSDCVVPGDSGCRRPPPDSSGDNHGNNDDEEEQTPPPPDPCAYCVQQCGKSCQYVMRMDPRSRTPMMTCVDPACCEAENSCLIECRRNCPTDSTQNEDSQGQSQSSPPPLDNPVRNSSSGGNEHCDIGGRDNRGGGGNGGRPDIYDLGFNFDVEDVQAPWPNYSDGDDDGDGVPPRVMWVNNGHTLLLWHFTDSGRGISSDIRGDRICRATIRYTNDKGKKIVRRQSSNRKKFTIGGTWRQQRFSILLGSKHAIRHLYEFDIDKPETEVAYIVGCEPDNSGRIGDWTLQGKGVALSPNYTPEKDKELSFVAIGDMWAKVSSDLC